MPRALLSVYDKTRLLEFAQALYELGWELVASGGTERELLNAGLPVTPINQVTGLPEMLGGRVKTLHPAIHAGILVRDKPEDLAELAEHGYAPISIVVCNLYPFKETVAQAGISLQDALEQIDIGGVTLLRAAAKNFFRTTVICDPADYARVVASLKAAGDTDLALRRDLAVKAFAHTRDYDTAIHAYLAKDMVSAASDEANGLPAELSLLLHRVDTLRYGENPHQEAAFYAAQRDDLPMGAQQLGGKELSYNNLLDVDAAWRTATSFAQAAVVIIKHLTPCGIATGSTIAEAFPLALASDPVSAFGGIIAVNRPVDERFVEALGALFIEVIVAPDFSIGAQALLNDKRKNCRLMKMPSVYDTQRLEIRSVYRGYLVQRVDAGDPEGTAFTTVTERAPTPDEINALQFAWVCVQHVKSNAIVLAKAARTVGIGGGLSSRLDACELAISKASVEAQGAVLASDAFFPFPDALEAAAAAGITAVIQPGGSIRDAQVIEAANKAGLAMVFTGTRHFRH